MLIECRDLCKQYLADGRPVRAVDRVNLQVRAGEFLVILGHSGSGKTTLLSLIGGLTSPDSGEVYVAGQENWHQGDEALSAMRNRRIGFIFQFASLIPTLTVLENILLPLSFGGRRKGGTDLALSFLAQLGMADKAGVYPSQLSGGQQRRVAIARAFINQPDIILADEPTGDLDEETEQEILVFFREHNRQGKTFVVVTHNRELAASQDTARVLRMRQGVLREAATV